MSYVEFSDNDSDNECHHSPMFLLFIINELNFEKAKKMSHWFESSKVHH